MADLGCGSGSVWGSGSSSGSRSGSRSRSELRSGSELGSGSGDQKIAPKGLLKVSSVGLLGYFWIGSLFPLGLVGVYICGHCRGRIGFLAGYCSGLSRVLGISFR